MADIRVERLGRYVLVHSVTPLGAAWVEDILLARAETLGVALVLDANVESEIIDAARGDGITIEVG